MSDTTKTVISASEAEFLVEHMDALSLGPRDILVVKCKVHVSHETARHIRESVATVSGLSLDRILVITPGIDLGIVRDAMP